MTNLFMVWWDRELKRRCREKYIIFELYVRYVDDIDVAVRDPVQSVNEEDVMTDI